MKDIYLGKNEKGEDIRFNFKKEGVRFVLLAGMSGSGKSIFHNNLYKELSEKHSPQEIGFIFMDMTIVDFSQWDSEYLVMPTIAGLEPEKALHVLETLQDEKRTIFVHIEECNMITHDKARFEKGLENIIKNNKNIILVYSTSKIIPECFDGWMNKYVDCKVIFRVATKEDSELLLGNDKAFNIGQSEERILAYNNKQIKCIPFSNDEVEKLINFKL